MTPIEILQKIETAITCADKEISLLKNSKDWISKAGYAQKIVVAQNDALKAILVVIQEAVRNAEVVNTGVPNAN